MGLTTSEVALLKLRVPLVHADSVSREVKRNGGENDKLRGQRTRSGSQFSHEKSTLLQNRCVGTGSHWSAPSRTLKSKEARIWHKHQQSRTKSPSRTVGW